MMSQPTRPLIRYHGGKWRLAPWVIAHFPPHRVYVEPFGGAASVLLRKPRAYAEIYNDLDSEIVNLFRVVRERGDELVRALELTPFARDEFSASYEPSADQLEQARLTVLRAAAGFGSASVNGQVSGFRANSNRLHTTPALDWRNFPGKLPAIIERLRGVVIENRDAAEVMRQHDGPSTLHYVDPPYVHATRNIRERSLAYRHELRDDDHVALADVLRGLTGFVVLSGYRCQLYDELYGDWQRIDRTAHADGARDRIESLWLSPNMPQSDLFATA